MSVEVNLPSSQSQREFFLVRAGAQPDNFDPYPIYRRLLECNPVWRSPWGDWYLSSFAAVSEAFHLRRSPASDRSGRAGDVMGMGGPIAELLGKWLIFADPPFQTPLHRELLIAFGPPNIAALKAGIAESCRTLLADASEGHGDFMDAFARPLPLLVIAGVLGLPKADLGRITAWNASMRLILDIGSSQEAIAAVKDSHAYFRDLIDDPAWRRSEAAQRFVRLKEAFPPEIAAINLAMLAFAGHETTVHLLGSTLLHLGLRPAAWRALQADPSLVPATLREVLRFEAPVQKGCRWTDREIELDGYVIPEGQLLVLLIGSALRDPAVFDHPDTFDIHRPPGPELAFGRGRYLCIGRSLAMLEAEIALGVLRSHWREVSVVEGGHDWHNNSTLRGLRRLELRWMMA